MVMSLSVTKRIKNATRTNIIFFYFININNFLKH